MAKAGLLHHPQCRYLYFALRFDETTATTTPRSSFNSLLPTPTQLAYNFIATYSS